jgi:phosphoglycerate dehydrogenase-like enzyme
MNQHSIVVTFRCPAEQRALLEELLGGDAPLTFLDDVEPAERGKALEEATVLFSWNFPREIQPAEYPHLQGVKLVQLVSAGADQMPFADLPSHLLITCNRGAYAAPMAEHVLAMVLALAKHVVPQHQKLAHGEFDQFTRNRRLAGMTAGILGFGGIGRATAHLMRSFGMKILAINTSGSSTEPADFVGTLDDLDHVLSESDVVVVSLPLNKATRGVIGSAELARMKADAILVNVARGEIIDEVALYEHSKTHPDFLVGIDAWWIEPFQYGEFRMDHPFLELPNVLGSPHNSAIVPGSLADGARQAAENIRCFLEGRQVTGVVRQEDGQ